ncbi:dolichyl-diphosphooligosaccharide--protein glycosyltransferase subunit 4 [Aspergillus clavatus NRRL 1]|uniref:Dolichyl-diphosphooligosaccharide--protein glycosyltransferase subunit 4 n=1 Tax=Aspergillus clavatus (strain ATCC 1007 / CBS 513.65 / DSM 816 / NCTC 3887 / NRRL 1 / QM 1276 / 107) TaxID=344612 RepID=A1CU09_ASPCL|nr:uncharacterized protein ACLA_084910 [Aspergillus clavatus NRRL 1]EAW06796.1 conserved hypothetical protein [Aspergillus clavatus NRRL 1]
MISDNDLYRLAVFLGSCAMMMIVLYHFLEVNAKDDNTVEQVSPVQKSTGGSTAASVPPVPATGGTSAIGGGKDRWEMCARSTLVIL